VSAYVSIRQHTSAYVFAACTRRCPHLYFCTSKACSKLSTMAACLCGSALCALFFVSSYICCISSARALSLSRSRPSCCCCSRRGPHRRTETLKQPSSRRLLSSPLSLMYTRAPRRAVSHELDVCVGRCCRCCRCATPRVRCSHVCLGVRGEARRACMCVCCVCRFYVCMNVIIYIYIMCVCAYVYAYIYIY
jgi:hypothetical protein